MLGVASVADAQGNAAVSATVTVPEVMQLSVLPGGGEVVTDGVYREEAGAVLLRVKANRSWKLVLTTSSPELVASNRGAGEASEAVWYRATVVTGNGSSESSFLEATAWGSVAVEGGPGDEIVIRLDYRWPEGGGTDAPSRGLTYTLSPG